MRKIGKKELCLSLLLIVGLNVKGQSVADQFKKIWEAHRGNWAQSFTWVEHTTNTQYNRTSEFYTYKSGVFPNTFRKDLGSLDDGNAELDIDEVHYTFKKFRQVSKGWPFYDLENLIQGKMYFQSFDSVRKDLLKSEISLDKGRSINWRGRKVLIFGTDHPLDTSSAQIWYDAAELYPVRWLYQGRSGTMDVQYLGYKKIDGVWFPTERKYYGNGKLYQHTKYEQVRFNIELDPAIFDPDQFGTYHWFKTIE